MTSTSTNGFADGELAAFCAGLADAVRPIALEYFRRPLDIVRKSDLSPVTIADRSIETTLRALIAERYPDHGIVGEEMGGDTGADLTWYLDPIDGTKSFISGMPLFGTLIALLDRRRDAVVGGMIDMPALGERWWGDGASATFCGRPARVSGVEHLADAQVYTSSPDFFSPEGWVAWERVSSRAAFRRYGGDCYIYGLLASGHCDLVMEMDLKPFDYMALVPVVEGAGGIMRDWNGDRLTETSDGRVVAAASPKLLDEVLALVAG